MIKNVQIIEKSSGRIIALYPTIIEIVDPKIEDFLGEAWEIATDECLVYEDNRDNYDIEIVGDVDDMPPE